MASKNDKAAERTQLNEEDMENGKALLPERRLDAREAMRAKGTGKRKNALGGPRKSLIRLDSAKEIQAFPRYYGADATRNKGRAAHVLGHEREKQPIRGQRAQTPSRGD